jgi:hypothetical protein
VVGGPRVTLLRRLDAVSAAIRRQEFYLFCGGTGTPAIFTLMAPRWLRLVK